MPYSQFTTLKKAVDAFGLAVREHRFFPEIQPMSPSALLSEYLEETLPLASFGKEKARSELIISPVLVETRRLLQHQISVFSGEELNIDETVGLSGVVDFLISRSPQQSLIQAPVVTLVEAKKADTTLGLGQCVAEMVAALRFNQDEQPEVSIIYGCVSSGTQWRFLKLKEQTVTIDPLDYPLPPVALILGQLVWIVQEGQD